MENYFKECRTAEDCKKTYYKYAKIFHSDNGGDDSKMKELNAQYQASWNRLKNIHKSNYTKEEHKQRGYKGEYKEYYEKATTEEAQDFIHVVSILMGLKNVTAEICGTWLWIGGDTYPVKDKLRMVGCRFSPQKRMWYWTKDHYTGKKKPVSMDKIREYYGSKKVDLEEKIALEG